MKPAEYLEAAKTALDMKSDYELAKVANVPPSQLYAAKAEKRLMPQPLMEAVAKALKLEFGAVYLDLKRQRKNRADSLKVSAPALQGAPEQEKDSQGVCIMSKVRELIMQIASSVHSTFSADQMRYGFAGS